VLKPAAFHFNQKLRLTSLKKPEDFPTFARLYSLEVPRRKAQALPDSNWESEGFMPGKKKYTNATFTKRVDHEAGRHRPARAQSEPAVCEECRAVYANRRWTAPGTAPEDKKHEHWRPAKMTVCPACQQKRTGEPRGFVYLDGAFFDAHAEEVEQLVHNESERAAEDNPLARILEWKRGEDHKLTVTTTTEHLAQRLGHALEKAFSGSAKYDFSHENKLARVTWQRD
jgi:hypothetical protein